MPPFLRLEFKKSSSKDFPIALRLAKHFTGFSREDKNGPYAVEIESMDELMPQWDDFAVLHYYTSKWTKTNIYFNGKLVNRIGKRNDFFYNIKDIHYCYRDYLSDAYKSIYCRSMEWNCIRLKAVNRRIKKYAWGHEHYYAYGRFKNSATWIVDKDRINQILSDEAEVKCMSACPAFRLEDIPPIVDTLPNEIKLDLDNWEIGYEQEYTENGFALVPTCIHHVEKEYPESIYEKAFGNKIDIPDNLTNDIANEIIDFYTNKATK